MENLEFLNERSFLKEIDELQVALRQSIEAFAAGLDDSPEAIKERRKKVLNGDFNFFAYTYFPHHIRGESSDFQANFCTTFPQLLNKAEGCKQWWVAPRGEAKSSLLTKVGPVFIAVLGLLQKPEIRAALGINKTPSFLDYVVLLGAETKMPTKLLTVVKTELESNAMLRMDFPEVCGRGAVWKVGELVTKTNVKIEPFGAEQGIRGTFHGASRPKVIMGDDLITDKESKSPTERNNRWDFLEAAIDYLGPPDGSVKYFGVGTILNKDDLISRAKNTIGHVVNHFKAIVRFPDNMDLWEKCEELMRNEDRKAEEQAKQKDQVLTDEQLPSYKFYLKNKRRMDKGAKTSWPSVRSLFYLMKQKAKNRRAFGTEMQGDPRSDEDKVFTGMTFWVQKLRHWVYFGGCDPSMGKGQTSDPSAILVGAWDTETSKLHVVEALSKRRVPSKLESDLIAVQREFNCQAIGFENNTAFEYMRTDFRRRALADHGVALPLVGVTATVDKAVRIDSLEPYINDIVPQILFHAKQTQLLDQLDEWPEKQTNHHFDALDALHILWMIASSRSTGLPKITTSGRGRRPSKGISGY